jgi:hypothetical protein
VSPDRHREGVAIYEFFDPWEARLARDALDDAGFEAWLESDETGPMGEGLQRFRVVVPAEDADEARAALTEPMLELPDGEVDHEPIRRPRRPIWIQLVAAMVLVGFAISYVQSFLWPWILLIGFVGFLVWRTVGPRRPY